jgi:HipA-like protein
LVSELDIWLGDQLVARTRARDRGRRLSIVYDESVVAVVGDEAPLLSCSLPTPGPSQPARARSFLEGLLPEGRALETMAARLRGVQLQGGAPATPADSVSLLAEYDRECAGAVVVVPSGINYRPDQGRYRRLDQADLAVLWATLSQDVPQLAAKVEQWRARELDRGKGLEPDTGLDIGL